MLVESLYILLELLALKFTILKPEPYVPVYVFSVDSSSTENAPELLESKQVLS